MTDKETKLVDIGVLYSNEELEHFIQVLHEGRKDSISTGTYQNIIEQAQDLGNQVQENRQLKQENIDLRDSIKDIANLLGIDTGDEYSYGDIELSITELKTELETLKNTNSKQEIYNIIHENTNFNKENRELKAENEYMKELFLIDFSGKNYKVRDAMEDLSEMRKTLDQLKQQLSEERKKYEGISSLIRKTKEYELVCSSCADDCRAYRSGYSWGVKNYTQEEVEFMTLKRLISKDIPNIEAKTTFGIKIQDNSLTKFHEN